MLARSGLQPVTQTDAKLRGYPVTSARDLCFSYDGRTRVLDGVSLDVESGAMTMILGRSGSGKTTLLKVLKGLLRPQSGTVKIAAGDAAGAVAYVPQTLGLVRSLSALDNVLTGALRRTSTARSFLKLFPHDLEVEAKDTLTRLGLSHKFFEPAQQLSGGERQRVAIARALMQKPTLILADEFVSQLDAITATEILDSMRAIARDQGVALLVTTHETGVVEDYADRVVVMRSGKIAHEVPGGALSQGDMLDLLR